MFHQQGVNFTAPQSGGNFSGSFNRGLQSGLMLEEIGARGRKRQGEVALSQVLSKPEGPDGYTDEQLARIRSINPVAGQQLGNYQLELKKLTIEQRKARREQDKEISDRAGRMFFGLSQVQSPAERMEVLHNYYRMAEASRDPVMVQAVKRVGVQLGLGGQQQQSGGGPAGTPAPGAPAGAMPAAQPAMPAAQPAMPAGMPSAGGRRPPPAQADIDQMFSDERMASGLSALLAGDLGLEALIRQSDNQAATERIGLQGDENRKTEGLRHGNTLMEIDKRAGSAIEVDQITGGRLLDSQLLRDRTRHEQTRELLGERDVYHGARTDRTMGATEERQNRGARIAQALSEGKHVNAVDIAFLRDELTTNRDKAKQTARLDEAEYQSKLDRSLAGVRNENVLEQLGFRRETGKQLLEQRGEQSLEQIKARGTEGRLTEEFRQKNRVVLANVKSKMRAIERQAKAGDNKADVLWKAMVGAARTQASQDPRMVDPSRKVTLDDVYNALVEEGSHDTLRTLGKSLGVKIEDLPVRGNSAGGTRGGGTSQTRGPKKPVWQRILGE